MSGDKYNIEYSTFTLIQKSYQYLLALLKYQSQKARQEAEFTFYEQVYGRAISNPESVRLAYVTDDLSPEAMKQLALENGIHVELDPAGHNYVIYDAKDEDALLGIVEEANTRERLLFERNVFHETEYGFCCYKTGEFIPCVDENGCWTDEAGHPHRSLYSPEFPENTSDKPERKYNTYAVWHRNSNGNLINEYGRVYCPVDFCGRFVNDKTGEPELVPIAMDWYTSKKQEFTQTAFGNMGDNEGQVCELPNEYGDILHEDGTVALNKMFEENYDERMNGLLKRKNKLSEETSTKTYMFDQDFNFVQVDRGGEKIYFRYSDGGYKVDGILHKSEAVQNLIHGNFSKNKESFGPELEQHNPEKNREIYTRYPGGYMTDNGDMLYNYNEYGDYYSAATGAVVINESIIVDEYYRVQRLLSSEREPVNVGFEYIATAHGNLRAIETGETVIHRNSDGKSFMELDGKIFPSLTVEKSILETELDSNIPDKEIELENEEQEMESNNKKEEDESERQQVDSIIPDVEQNEEETIKKRHRKKVTEEVHQKAPENINESLSAMATVDPVVEEFQNGSETVYEDVPSADDTFEKIFNEGYQNPGGKEVFVLTYNVKKQPSGVDEIKKSFSSSVHNTNKIYLSGITREDIDKRNAPTASNAWHIDNGNTAQVEKKHVTGNTINLNWDALHKELSHGIASGGIITGGLNEKKQQEATAAKWGFTNMTAEKKFGFNSVAPINKISHPSAEGLIGAFAGGYQQLIYGGTKESHNNSVRYVRTAGAAFNTLGGNAIYKNAIRTSGEYFLKLQKSNGLSAINETLKINGCKAVNFMNTAGIRETNQNILKIAGKHGLVEDKAGHFVAKDFSDAAFRRMGLVHKGDIEKFKNSLKTAISQENGRKMAASGKHVLYYTARIGAMGSDPTVSYALQMMDSIRVGQQTVKAVKEVYRSNRLKKHLSYTKNTEIIKQPAAKVTLKVHKTDKLKEPIYRMFGMDKEAVEESARAKQIYGKLREQEKAWKWNYAHRHEETKFRRLEAKQMARESRVLARKEAGRAYREKFLKPYKVTIRNLGNTRPGIVAKNMKHMVVNSKSYIVVRSVKNAVSKAAAEFSETISKIVNTVARKIALFLGIYVLVCVLIVFLAVMLIVPTAEALSAETNDEELSGGVTMEDVYSKANTITGIIFNELRYMEVEWASETRTYGTSVKPLSLNELNFTEYNVSPKQYVLSQTGAEDLLGIWAYDSTKQKMHDGRPLKYEGILGPEPFEGAALEDYKLLRDIDGGNTLELRGKPQEGFTSNAKQVTSMASVFYGQSVDTLMEESNASKGLAGFVQKAKYFWKAAWTYFETNDVPILGWIAKYTGWSWTSVYRNYAYPLMQASHQENFFLSSYIYPTKFTTNERVDSQGNITYTAKIGGSKWDGAKGGNPDENGDQTVKIDQVTGVGAKNGRIGVTTEGGSGKVTSDFLSSPETYGEYGDEGWKAIERCPEDLYGGYGCQQRYSFAYKYQGHFATDKELNVTRSDELSSLYYGGNPDEDGDYSNVSNVSSDVSPWNKDSDAENGYNRDSCIIHILKLTDEASECWELEEKESLEDYNFEDNTPLLDETFYSERLNDEYLHDGLEELKIQQVEETEDGCKVYVSLPFSEETVYDRDGNALLDENGKPIKRTVYAGDGYILHFKHSCKENHLGVYCGGHLQLRTRSVVYGFSEKQEEEGTFAAEGQIAAFVPKYLDPINYKDPNHYDDAENRYPNDSDVAENEKAAYPDLHVWNINEHSLLDGEETPYIEEENLKSLYKAQDIFDIDDMILRKKDSYAGYSGKDEGKSINDESSSLPKWTGWTISNIGNAVSIANNDWFEAYALADTQTSVGGIFDNNSQKMNAVSDSVKNRIVQKLNTGLNLLADILDPEAVNVDGNILAEEEREMIDRIRHVEYALDTVGKVSYSQSAHVNLYGNISGSASDCSGYVSNIWRDRFETSLTTAALMQIAEDAGTLHEYHGLGTTGIKPGDIILKDPEDVGGSAHALLYIGTFNTSDLYGGLSGTERVYTVDCSSMVLNLDDLASDEDIPVKSAFFKDGEKISVKDGYKNYEKGDKEPMVRGGNVRFCDRNYVNEDTPNMYYIDMTALPRVGQRQLRGDFSELGDSVSRFWESSAVLTDLTKTRDEADIEFPINIDLDDLVERPAEDVEIPEDDRIEPDDPIVDDESVILPMNQYINQGNGSWAQHKRGGIGSNSTIKQAGCIDCCYLMAASYYNHEKYDVTSILTNSRYYSSNSFSSGTFLNDFGLSQSISGGFNKLDIREAIEMGHPVILEIKGAFSFHRRNSGHFLVIMGYNKTGFMVYDPGSNDNSYCNTGRVIPYEAFTKGLGSIRGYRVIRKN